MIRVLADVGDFCLWASSVLIVIFVVQYTFLAPWYRNFLGITIVGEALALLAIYVPSLLALADPAAFANFASARWYLFLSVGIVAATTLFLATRIVTWEIIRRERAEGDGRRLPAAMAKRIAELEAEVARLRAAQAT